ncbi:hypothetical protein CSOJ01_00590 [Colletotrichum sojae]|uniref:Uncharacterized protein n=1 Tax=Colletotrichum sojae TaxID=2175907 RepID=A0A8H6JXS2_9PEZI|nr:hypothetical protein CSOJ01_00590 [Colletotrichum sojae]
MGKLDEMTRRRWLGVRALGLAAEPEATRSTFHFHASDSMPVHEMKGSLHSPRVAGAGVGRVLKLVYKVSLVCLVSASASATGFSFIPDAISSSPSLSPVVSASSSSSPSRVAQAPQRFHRLFLLPCPSLSRARPTLPALAGLRRGESATQDSRPKTGPCGLWHSTGVLFPAANFISGPVCPSLLPPWSVVPDAQVPLASPEIPPTLDKSNNGPEKLRPHHTPPKTYQQDLLRCAAQSTSRRT